MPGNESFWSSASFLIALLTLSVNKLSRDLIISFISSISLFEIVNAVMPDPKTFFWIPAPVADAGAINPSCIKTLLANSFSAFFY